MACSTAECNGSCLIINHKKHTHIHTNTYIIHTYTYILTHTHIHIHTHRHTYIHINTYIHIYIIPITKPDTQNSQDVTKYRPISLLNIGGKILEGAWINRINHHIHSTEFLKRNQYGFIPQTSTIDAIMAVKEFVQEGFSKGEITVTVSLDVEGAFNSAWWPSVLKNLQESG